MFVCWRMVLQPAAAGGAGGLTGALVYVAARLLEPLVWDAAVPFHLSEDAVAGACSCAGTAAELLTDWAVAASTWRVLLPLAVLLLLVCACLGGFVVGLCVGAGRWRGSPSGALRLRGHLTHTGSPRSS